MITPRFSLSQDEIFLTINIRSPYCSLKELEVFVDGNDFRFICHPYYLRLNLPGRLIENDYSTGQFLSETGEFIFKYQKENKGEHFDGLDFITSLLAPARKEVKVPEIEVLTSENCARSSSSDGDEWFLEQNIPKETPDLPTNSCKYGFANQKYNILRDAEDEFYSVFEIRNADKMSLAERSNLRHDTESMDFSSDHYLMDYFDDSIIQLIIKSDNPWKQLRKDQILFSNEERDLLKDLPNKEYLLTDEEVKFVLYGVLDILFAYCYDRRTTDFEGNCESGWTVTKLSATLSWFDQFDDVHQVIATCFRRSLTYPLYRNLELCNTVLQDLKLLFTLGNVCVIKCLVDIYNIFNSSSEPRYILNELYIKDYIIYMQKCSKLHLAELVNNLNDVAVTIQDMNLNLDKIIANAVRASMKKNDILEKMSRLKLSCENTDSETSSSDDTTSESDDTTSSSSDYSES